MGRLRWFNGVMGLVHFVQGILMLWLSTAFSLPVSASFLRFDPAAKRLVPTPETLFDLRIGPLVAAFLFMSALAHFLIASPGIYDWYIRNLKRGINYARWIEYAFSASVMIVAIAMLVGIYDIASLVLIFALNAMMMLFGLIMELHNQATEKTNWTSFWFGVIAGAVPWVAIAIYLIGAGSGVPSFVYWIYVSIFLFFNSFAINMVLQYKKVGPWREYLYGERAYIVLSLVAKSALAWQVFAGTLRPA
ncbi:MAG: heliorhodopsin HeR [Chloroflexota bacterium]